MNSPDTFPAGRLLLGAPDDHAEHEARHAAHRVAAGGAAAVRPATGPVRGTEIDSVVRQRIAEAWDRGRPLPDADRARLEHAFGTNLGDVRLHTGAEAGALCRALDARAFTVGDHVFLGDPHDPGLLAHELAHVLQRETGVVRRVVSRMGVGQRVITMTEQQVLDRVRSVEDGRLHTDAVDAGVDVAGCVRAYVDSATPYELMHVYDELRRLTAATAFDENLAQGSIPGVRLQYVSHEADGVDQEFAAVETPDTLDVHPGQILFKATIAARLGTGPGGVDQAGRWTLGMVQTVLSANRVITFDRPDHSARTVTTTLPGPASDRREDTGPWYDLYRSSSALTLDYQVADVLLDDQPGFTLGKHPEETLSGLSGADEFRTWLVLREDDTGAICWLYAWDWRIDYSATGGTVSLVDGQWYPDGSGAVLDGQRASAAAVSTSTETEAAEQWDDVSS